MGLSNDLISQFVKVTKDDTSKKDNTTVYGTIKIDTETNTKQVQIDGSSMYTPINSTVDVHDGDRVIVTIKNHTATVTGNLTSPAAKVEEVTIVKEMVSTKVSTDEFIAEQGAVRDLVAEKVSTDYFESETSSIKNLISDKVSTEEFNTEKARVSGLLDAANANITSLSAEDVKISNKLDATEGVVDTLNTNVGDIKKLIFGSAEGNVINAGSIQSTFSNAVVAQLGNAQIKNAMIDGIAASKIMTGSIITNNVQVRSDNDSLVIDGEKIQISDGSRVRVQIGQDGSKDYSISVWDKDGNLMFSKGGITASAIKSAIISDNMVSDNANIKASKLDIESLFEEINNSEKTIKSSQIYLDEEEQTLNVAFYTLEGNVNTLEGNVTSQGSAIEVLQGNITNKIWQQDIDEVAEGVNELNTQYSELSQRVDGISSIVGDNAAVLDNIEKVNEKVIANTSLIEQLSDSISTLVTDVNGASLMKQTTTGWTFSTADIQKRVNEVSDHLSTLTDEFGATSNAITVLEQAVSDLGVIGEYVEISTYQGEPCVELGERDSDFKLRITNTRMIFTEGSTILAYFNNQSLHIKKAVVEEEFQQGNFVWKARSNGNLGLVWKGAPPVAATNAFLTSDGSNFITVDGDVFTVKEG